MDIEEAQRECHRLKRVLRRLRAEASGETAGVIRSLEKICGALGERLAKLKERA